MDLALPPMLDRLLPELLVVSPTAKSEILAQIGRMFQEQVRGRRAHDGGADAARRPSWALAKLAAKARDDYGDAYYGRQIKASLRKVLDA